MPFYKGVPGVFAGDTCAQGPIREAILLCVQVYGPWTMARQGKARSERRQVRHGRQEGVMGDSAWRQRAQGLRPT